MFCSNCGSKQEPDTKPCASCGAAQATVPPPYKEVKVWKSVVPIACIVAVLVVGAALALLWFYEEAPAYIVIRGERFSTSLTRIEFCDFELTNDDIVPLRYMTNLQELHFCGTQITDISPLSGLVNLERLDLYNNQINDISPLSELVNLEWLDLYDNQINDVSPLFGLVSLETLDLSGNQISDISPLARLVVLNWVDLSNNPIADWSPVDHVTNVRGREG